jgi:hypothetical protein
VLQSGRPAGRHLRRRARAGWRSPRVTSLVRDDLLRTGRGCGRLWRAWSARGALPGDSHERQRSKWCGQTATSMELREREGGCEGWGDGPGVSLPQHLESTQRVTRVHIPLCTHSNKQTEVNSHRIVYFSPFKPRSPFWTPDRGRGTLGTLGARGSAVGAGLRVTNRGEVVRGSERTRTRRAFLANIFSMLLTDGDGHRTASPKP